LLSSSHTFYAPANYLVGNKADTGSSQRRVSSYDVAAFAESKHLDFIETSALTGENVERAFRRLVLSVAKLLPDVRVHLELTGLPDGWLSTYRILSTPASATSPLLTEHTTFNSALGGHTDTTDATVKSPSRSSNRIMDSSSTPQSKHNSVEVQSDPTIEKLKGSTVNTSVATSDGIQLLDSCASENSLLANDMTLSPSGINVAPELVIVYTNYWTGEETTEIPRQAAPTGFFFEAKMTPIERFSEYDQPIKRESSA
jgi:hypothetical protein